MRIRGRYDFAVPRTVTTPEVAAAGTNSAPKTTLNAPDALAVRRFSAIDAWAFALPAISFVQIAIGGQLIVSEILVLVMLPWLWGARDRLPIPRWFVVLGVGWLISQIMTDVVVGSAFADYTRGWAAIVFTLTDFAAILILVSTPGRACLFAIGLAVGGCVGYVVAPNVFAAAGDSWKFAFAFPVGFTMAVGLSGSRGARHCWLTVCAFLGFGVLNFLFGFRSLGGVSLLTAGYLIFRIVFGRRQTFVGRSMLRSFGGLILLAMAVAATLQIYDVAASQGLLGLDAQARYANQSGALSVLVGGRTEILVSSQAVIDSPILGHGSWAKDFAYVDLLGDRLSSFGYEMGAGLNDLGLIPAHSYLMQSWVWAGLLGAVFWLAVLTIAVWMLADPTSLRVDIAPLLVFSTMLLIWNIVFSPYSAGQRILASYGLALCLLGLQLTRGQGTKRLRTTA